jgi:N-acetylmuramoyl-L-alanine amidase
VAALLLCISGQVSAENIELKEVRHWSQNGVTRVAVQLSGKPEVRRDRLSKPERYFFDFQGTSPARRGMQTIAVNDALVRQIRVAEPRPGVARVVLDLVGEAELVTSELANPYRLIIEVRRPGSLPPAATPAPVISATPTQATPVSRIVRPFPLPTRVYAVERVILPLPPAMQTPGHSVRVSTLPKPLGLTLPTYWTRSAGPQRAETVRVAPPSVPVVPSKPTQSARQSAPSGNSMTRALGLKIRRVVLDPGHGGHDQGSSGPTGLLEKELVLDVSLRLGELITTQLGSEVVYTRNDDQFVPLETRTKIANDSRADLFVSIHANSSTYRSVSGVETYFLSFTTSKEALDIAARENSTSQRSVFELRDLLQKIALQEKIEESREFAARVNAALYRVWGPAGNTRNRGVKKAPFVVLIGASMPSILTEIGFLSNPRDEKEMKKPETRQKIAEALYKGIAQYADSLSNLAVARRGTDE